MKIIKTLLVGLGIISLGAADTNVGSLSPDTVRINIPVPTAIANPIVASNQVMLSCAFWTEWVLETNTSPVIPLLNFDNVSPGGKWTNSMAENSPPPLPGATQSSFIRTGIVQTETLFVSSNLFSYLVWRGLTNRHCLESIPITNMVRKYRYEAKKNYE